MCYLQDEHELRSGIGLCDNLSYSVKRLVRGLSSNRDGARQGFAVCLTEVSATVHNSLNRKLRKAKVINII